MKKGNNNSIEEFCGRDYVILRVVDITIKMEIRVVIDSFLQEIPTNLGLI